MFRIVRRADLFSVGLCLPIVLYCTTHNGIRQTMLWVVLAIVAVGRVTDRAAERAESVVDPPRPPVLRSEPTG